MGSIRRSATVKSDHMHVFSSTDHCDLFLIDFSNLIPPSCHRSCCPLLPDYYSPNTSWPSISLLLQMALLLHLMGKAPWRPSASTSYTSTSPALHRSLSHIPSPPFQGRTTYRASERMEKPRLPVIPTLSPAPSHATRLLLSFTCPSFLLLNSK